MIIISRFLNQFSLCQNHPNNGDWSFSDFWLYDIYEDYEIWQWDYAEDGKIDYADLGYLLEFWPDDFNEVDFAMFANQWQKEIDERFYDTRTNLYSDDRVDFKDFTILASEWGQTTTSSLPAISISVNGDANNLKGDVGVSVTGCTISATEVFVCMDGQLLGKMNNEFGQTPGLTVDSASYLNGRHSFKAIVTDSNGNIVTSSPYDVNFNNPIHCLNMEDTYEPNKAIKLRGFSADESNSMIKLADWFGNVVWSQQVSGNLDFNIPGGFLDGKIYDVSIEHQATGLSGLYEQMLALDSGTALDAPDWEQIWQKAITQKYDPNKSYKFVIVLPNAYTWGWCGSWSIRLNTRDCRKYAVAGMINGCQTMNMDYLVLYGDKCTWDNFAKVFTGPKSNNILYVYLASIGGDYPPGSYWGTAQRTWFQLSDSIVVSNLNTPVNGRWDNNLNIHPLTSLGLTNYNRFKIVWIDICLNGRYSDMAHAWLGGSGEELGWPYSLYVSWSQAIEYCIDLCPSQWTSFFWGYPNPNKGFGLYGANTYEQAFADVQNRQEGGPACVGSALVYNSLQGTIGDISVRFTGYRSP